MKRDFDTSKLNNQRPCRNGCGLKVHVGRALRMHERHYKGEPREKTFTERVTGKTPQAGANRLVQCLLCPVKVLDDDDQRAGHAQRSHGGRQSFGEIARAARKRGAA